MGISLAPPQTKVAEAVAPTKKAIAEEKVASPESAGSGAPQRHPAIVAEPTIDKFKKTKPAEPSLDELIYAYLTAGQGES